MKRYTIRQCWVYNSEYTYHFEGDAETLAEAADKASKVEPVQALGAWVEVYDEEEGCVV